MKEGLREEAFLMFLTKNEVWFHLFFLHLQHKFNIQ